MRKIRWIIMTAAVILFAGGLSFAAGAEEAEPDEWTVMIYLCGSDLESKYGYASENLGEIQGVDFPYDESIELFPDASYSDILRDIGKVNILVETGGSKEWHTRDLGMDIDTNALQRWYYKYYPENIKDRRNTHVFELLETLPLQNMAAPETLADFIRWGAETYPAQKYALVLWDHGAAAQGIFYDELFEKDLMYLYELGQALADGGVHLDTLIIDACMMANLETAWTVKDCADYMVASQEDVPGAGTAFRDWLQALVDHPSLDGRWLAECVCDMTGIKYADMENERSKSLLTWSVIDLSRIDSLISACGAYIRSLNSLLKNGSPLFPVLIQIMTEDDIVYKNERQTMIDLGSVLLNKTASNFVDPEILDPMIDALSKAVIYISRGDGRSKVRGISFCFLAGLSGEDLDIYAKNFPMPDYLALADAISSWTAPEEIFTGTERLPEIGGIQSYQLTGEKIFTENGMPAISIDGPFNYGFYNLYGTDEKTGETILLGQTDCYQDLWEGGLMISASDPMHWPTLEGTLCCIELVESTGDEILYNIPIEINSDIAMLRCGRKITYGENLVREGSEYEVYGVWEGYEENSQLLNRSVRPLAMMAGVKYSVLYPVDSAMNDGKVSYVMGEEKTVYRALDVKEEPLPPGTYYLEYQVADAFMRVTKTERIEIQWDGENMTFPDEASWEGSI